MTAKMISNGLGLTGCMTVQRTVENGTGEVRQELEKHVLLLSSELVPASLLATGSEVAFGKTLLHVGIEPFLGRDEAFAGNATATLLPELPLGLLGLVVVLSSGAEGDGGLAAAITVGRDEADKIGILVVDACRWAW